MGRRTDHTREEIKKMLIESAFKLVDTKGMEFFNARKISSEIGYSAGTIYNLFANLEELMLYVNLKTVDLLIDEMEKVFQKVADRNNLGGAVAKHYLHFARTHPGLWSLLFETAIEDSPDWYEQHIEKSFSRLELYLGERDRKNGKILWASVHGICLLKLRGKLGKEKPEELCNMLFNQFLS